MRHQRRMWPAFIAVAGIALAGCRGQQAETSAAGQPEKGDRLRAVTLGSASIREIGLVVVTAEVKPIEGHMTFPAKLLAHQDLEAQVGSLVEGRVRQVFVSVGDRVKEGEELMHIEGLEVGAIKSNFIKAKAQLQYAAGNYERQKTLFEQQVGSQKSYFEARAEYDKSLAEFNAEDKRIHSIGLTDDDLAKFVEHAPLDAQGHSGGVLPIKAPLAGIVVERTVVIGQLVNSSTTAFRIVNTSTLWADGQVYEKDIPRLSDKAEARLTVTAYPGEVFKGKIVYISPVVDDQTRTTTIRASIPNHDGRLKPHMFGELHVAIGRSANGLVIPAEAVLKDDGKDFVFIAVNDTTFERRDILPGLTYDSMIEVRQGIRPGERVVTKGSFQIKSELLKDSLEGGE